ncbi:MAG: hypothetical protein EOO82_02040 [Oxalobacteraceae bacterium]|nr:MAG: hypothetical protein EOO82_02040 [Oxalobacteraceae bacterium]
MFWDRIAGQEVSGLGWLLHGNPTEAPNLPGSLRDKMQDISAEDFARDLSILGDTVPDKIELRNVEDFPAKPPGLPPGEHESEKRRMARSFRAPIDRAWRVASFSSLIAGAFSEVPDYDDTRATGDGVSDPALEAIHQFPAGARTGICFHAVSGWHSCYRCLCGSPALRYPRSSGGKCYFSR